MIPDSVAVLLLLGLVAALHTLWARRGDYDRGFMNGYAHGVEKMTLAIGRRDAARSTDINKWFPYDYEKEGL